MANAEQISVTVVYALPERQWQVAVTLPAGSTLPDAVAASGLLEQIAGLAQSPLAQTNAESAELHYGIFGKLEKAPALRVLKDGERVEIYRPLLIDPKEARKARAAKARARRG